MKPVEKLKDKQNPTVSIILLNWNGRKFLDACLNSLKEQTYRDFELIFVDNGSEDGSVEHVRKCFPELPCISNGENLGFAEGNNVGIRKAQGRYIILLSVDITVDKDWLKELVSVAESSPGVGMISPRILLMNPPDTLNSTGIMLTKSLVPYSRGNRELENGQYQEVDEVFCPLGASAFYRREMLDDVGLLDSDFFVYHEEFDLGWRAQLRGWKCLYAPRARVYHYSAGTSLREGTRGRYLLERNRYWAICKNLSGWRVIRYLPAILLYDVAIIFLYLFIRRDLAPFKGKVSALTNLGPMVAKRREIQRSRKVKDGYIFRKYAPRTLPPWKGRLF